MVTEPRLCPPTSSRPSETSSVVSDDLINYRAVLVLNFLAHTFRVQPGFESDTTPAGQDIHVKWTATSGNVSVLVNWSVAAVWLTAIGLLVYLQRLEFLLGKRVFGKVDDDIGVENYDIVLCRWSCGSCGAVCD